MALLGKDSVIKAIYAKLYEINDEVIAIYTETLTDTTIETPKHFEDGGRLANSWSLSESDEDVQPRGASKSAAGALNSIAKMPKFVLGKKLYFINPMPYAAIVEYGGYPENPENGTLVNGKYKILSINGYSRQAPAGMLRTNLTKAKVKLRNL